MAHYSSRPAGPAQIGRVEKSPAQRAGRGVASVICSWGSGLPAWSQPWAVLPPKELELVDGAALQGRLQRFME